MGLNSYQVTFESCGDHYQIYGRDIQDVMGGVTGGPACIGKTCGGKRGVRSCSLDWLGRQIIYKHIRRYEY